MENRFNPKYKVGDEVSLETIVRIVGINIEKDWITETEKIVYTVEGADRMRAVGVRESCLYPLPTPEEVANGKRIKSE